VPKHPKEIDKVPTGPFPSEEEMSQAEAEVLKQQRKQSGGLEDASQEGDAKVVDSKPYKDLRSG
jgi:hypothetical protein